MKTQKSIIAILFIATTLLGCKKKGEDIDKGEILTHSMTVESIIGTTTGNITATRKGFMNLYEGLVYSQTEAIANSSKVDFAYNYHGGGCSTCRFFENVSSMSTRTGYVNGFSTITKSLIVNAEYEFGITRADFDGLRNAEDIDKLFTSKDIKGYTSIDISNRTTDIMTGKIFAFIDKNGKKGFFTVGDYQAKLPTGDAASLNLQVKIQK